VQKSDPEDEWRRREVRRLFVKHHPTAPTGADVYAFSAWLLQNEPDLLRAVNYFRRSTTTISAGEG